MKLLRTDSTRHKALTFKTLLQEGNFLFDVMARFRDDSVDFFLAQGRTAREVERNILNSRRAIKAVARKIDFGD